MPITATTNGDATSAFQAALGSVGFQNNTLDGLAQVQLAVANLIANPRTAGDIVLGADGQIVGSATNGVVFRNAADAANTFAVSNAGAITFYGAATGLTGASVASTITSATPATTRLTQSEITCTPATTFAVASGGSLAGVRGGVTISASKSFTDGFLYGAQGKVTNNGTMAEASAARIAGVLGQVDLAAGTITAGQVSCLWGDFQGSTPTLTVPDQINVLRLTNSIGTGTINAAIFVYGAMSYLMELGAASGPAYFGASAPTTLAKSLKIKVGGVDYYIGLYTSAS